MADYTFPNLTTAIAGINTNTYFKVQSTSSYQVEVSNGTIRVSGSGLNFGVMNQTSPGWITGRRPVSGQVFPRGVYNK